MSTHRVDFHFDFETRSRLNLKDAGAVKYAAHPSTEVTLLTWAFGRTGKVKAWRIGQPIPAELVSAIKEPHRYHFIAANIAFDYMIWIIPFARQIKTATKLIDLVRPKIENLTDLLALAQHFRVGGSLEIVAQMLNIPMSKDKEGRRLMLKQCKINKKTGQFTELTSEEWVHFERYGIIDTVILREAYYKLPHLPSSERWIFEWTLKRNLTGIAVDTALVQILDEIVKHYMPKLENEFKDITGLKPKSPKCLAYFQPHFPWIKDMRADTVREMQLKTNGVSPTVVRALELKALSGSTSIAKVKCATNMLLNGRIYGLFAYHMAQTKRFAGKGIQIHNFPRPSHDALDELPELDTLALATEVRDRANTLQDPIDFVKNLLRRIWVVPQGNTLYCGDFSKVEPTVLRWLTGMGPVSKTAYEEMAVEIYSMPLEQIGKDSEERQVGKAAVLGCLAAGTQVRVSSVDCVYYKNIEDITLDDEIWDGEEWVEHDGVSVNGMKTVIKIRSLAIESTPDHLFLSKEGWVTAVELNADENMRLLKSGRYSDYGQSPDQSLGKVSKDMSLCAVYVGVKRLLESISSGKEWTSPVNLAHLQLLEEDLQNPIDAATWLVTQGLEVVGTLASTTLKRGATILKTRTGTVMEVEELDVSLNPSAHSWNTLLRWIGLTNGVSRLTGRIMMDTMKPETYESLVSQSTGSTKATYDIKNCGPSNRYALERGIAHNCGYGMGHVKFKDDTFSKTGVVFDLKFAKHAVHTWRKINQPITQFWGDLQSAFRKAIHGEVTALCDRKIFVMPMESPWRGVQIKLPSGSYLYYHNAHAQVEVEQQEIVEVVNGQTVVRKVPRTVENLYYTIDRNKRVIRTKIYGGLLCEHVTSATARDLLTYSMYNLDQAGFDVLSTVHDEVWGDSHPGREDEFRRTMCILPYWCPDIQLTADTDCGVRYLK